MLINSARTCSVLATLAISFAGCGALPQARMALPDNLLEAATRQPIEGLGGVTQGNFRVGDSSGGFKRSATRLNFLDLVQRDRSAVRFDLSGSEWPGGIRAECLMRQVSVETAMVSFPVKRLAYRCQFESENDPQGSLVLLESESASALGAPRREGTVSLLGRTLSLRAVHALAGSPFQMPAPSGYVFEREGRAVGAVEMTDTSKPDLLLAPGVTPEERRLMTLAGLALSLLWEQ